MRFTKYDAGRSIISITNGAVIALVAHQGPHFGWMFFALFIIAVGNVTSGQIKLREFEENFIKHMKVGQDG